MTKKRFYAYVVPGKRPEHVRKPSSVARLARRAGESRRATHRDFRAKDAKPDEGVAIATPRRGGRLAAENIGVFAGYGASGRALRGVAESWGECERIVSGQIGARYRGFVTKEEAKEWLRLGAWYEIKTVKKLEPGIYFDAGTGRGGGVEISVTDERGKNFLHKALAKKKLNRFGKHMLGGWATNNYGELLACKYAIEIAAKEGVKKVFGDSKLVIDFWSKWRVKKQAQEETFELAREVAGLRKKFEDKGGKVIRISGDDNPADLGFH